MNEGTHKGRPYGDMAAFAPMLVSLASFLFSLSFFLFPRSPM